MLSWSVAKSAFVFIGCSGFAILYDSSLNESFMLSIFMEFSILSIFIADVEGDKGGGIVDVFVVVMGAVCAGAASTCA